MLALGVCANVAVGALASAQADDVMRARAEAIALSVVTAADGTVSINDSRDDAALDVGTWIFADGTILERPTGTSTRLDDLAFRAAANDLRLVDTGGPENLLLYVLPVTENSTQVATVVTSTSLAPYDGIVRSPSC